MEGSERSARRARKRKPKKVKVAKPKPARYIEDDDGSPVMIEPAPKPSALAEVFPKPISEYAPEIAKLADEGKITTGTQLQSKPPIQRKPKPSARASKAQGRFHLSTNRSDLPDNRTGRPKPGSKSSASRRDRTEGRQARAGKRQGR